MVFKLELAAPGEGRDRNEAAVSAQRELVVGE